MGFTIGTPLLLPERHGLFDSIDRLPARGKGLVSMRRARRDADSDVADTEPADSMDSGNPDSSVLGGDALEHNPHLLVSQALVGFVVESRDPLPVGVIPDDAMEDANPARSWMLNRLSYFIE